MKKLHRVQCVIYVFWKWVSYACSLAFLVLSILLYQHNLPYLWTIGAGMAFGGIGLFYSWMVKEHG